MVVEIINIKKCLVISDAIRKIAMRTGAIRTSNVHSVDAITALSLVHFYVRSRDQFAKLGGNASFYTYINQIFDDKCELVSKICSRRKVRRVQTYSLRNRLNLSLTSRTGRSQNLFAELNPFRIFVMRQNRIARFTKYIKAFGRISVALLLRVVAVLSQELGVRPLFMQLTDLCSTKCDRTTQAVRRIIVPLLHLYPNYRTSSISRTERSQSVYNHSLWTILKSSPRCSVSFL